MTVLNRSGMELRFHLLYLLQWQGMGLCGRIAKPEARPRDIWHGSAEHGKAINEGTFTAEGWQGKLPREGDWLDEKAGPEWHAALWSFGWVRDFRAHEDTKQSAARLREKLEPWLEELPEIPPGAYAPEVAGARINYWLSQAKFILAGSRVEFRRRWLRAIAREALRLKKYLRVEELPTLEAAQALLNVSFVLPGAEHFRASALRALEHWYSRHESSEFAAFVSNPVLLMRTLRHLCELHDMLQRVGLAELVWLGSVIKLLADALRNQMHGDGRLALFHNAWCYPAAEIAELLKTAEGHSPRLSVGQGKLAQGIKRLAMGDALALVDVQLPQGQNPFFSTMACEFSYGKERIVVNCGAFRGGDDAWRRASRATAAHSVLCVEDMNAVSPAALGKTPPSITLRDGELIDAHFVEMESAAYAALGISCERQLYLKDKGNCLQGVEKLTRSTENESTPLRVMLRMHLHPAIRPELQENGKVKLRTSAGGIWMFEVDLPHAADLEQSIYLGEGGKPQRTTQIVVRMLMSAKRLSCEWSLRKSNPAQ